ncbi:annexin A4 [Octopus bimaculoides]|uniref:Annexin n=1 Tax=Octopus bimaculoides TaxID=37653 RepID=A0A0L8GVP7_OCTBM|nr:annexin A4 [Octopus bimaculoides]|eukprot:XP_014777883.1 PREDICTED: annexin A4-like [Octopus bimaculoides]
MEGDADVPTVDDVMKAASKAMGVPLRPKVQGTIIPDPSFNADDCADRLQATMKGLGTKDRKLIEILTKHTCEQRQEIEKSYNARLGVLRDDIDSDLSGHYKDMCLSLLDPFITYDCKELNRAVRRLGTDESTLVEILFTRSNENLGKIKEEYEKTYGTTLEMDVASDTSGDFQDLLKLQMEAQRDETYKVQKEQARQDAQELYAAGEKRFGTSERRFNNIFCKRSFFHLKYVCEYYTEIAGHDIEEAVKSETSGDLKSAYLDIVRMSRSLPGYFAYRLNKSMKGLGTKDLNLIRLLVSRSEIDMVQIREEYEKMFDETLATAIQGEAMGDYEEVLLALIGHRA